MMYEKRVVVTVYTEIPSAWTRDEVSQAIDGLMKAEFSFPGRVIAQTDWYERKKETEESEMLAELTKE